MPEETLLLVEDYIDGKLHVFDQDWPELPFAHREHIGCTVDYVAGRNRYMGYLISLGVYGVRPEISSRYSSSSGFILCWIMTPVAYSLKNSRHP